MGTSLAMELLLPLVGRAGELAAVVGEWLLTYAVHSTAMVLTAWALVALMPGRWSPSAQAAIWRTALVAGWVTSTVQLAAPWRSLAGQLQLPPYAHGVLTAVQVRASEHTMTPPAGRTPVLRSAYAPPAPVPDGAGAAFAGLNATALRRVTIVAISYASLTVAGWALVAALFAAHLAWLRRRLRLAIGGRHDASASLAGHALRHLQRQSGVMRPVALSVTDALAVPAALPGDEIVLPLRAMRELTLAEQEGVLAHELAHVVRRDTAWLQLATWIERLAWFQPLNRLARRRMQCAAEFAADAWASRITGQPLRLAQALVRVASWRSTGASGTAWASALGNDGSPLVDRVRRLTTHGSAPSTSIGGAVACAAMVAVAAAATLLLPQVALGRPALSLASEEARVQLHLSGEGGTRDVAAWRRSAETELRGIGPGGSPPRLRGADARPETADLLRRAPQRATSSRPMANRTRAILLVRGRAGTPS
jgi:beta-lactamase regulating signal transducer with metallopeptidase domain